MDSNANPTQVPFSWAAVERLLYAIGPKASVVVSGIDAAVDVVVSGPAAVSSEVSDVILSSLKNGDPILTNGMRRVVMATNVHKELAIEISAGANHGN